MTKVDFPLPAVCDGAEADTSMCGQGAPRRPVRSGSSEWSKAFLATQQAVTAAGADLQAVMMAVVNGALDILPQAAGAVIEMREGDEIVYRAASGTSANAIGMRLKMSASLSGRCLEQGRPVRCDDSETDPRVDREACRRIGVRSMVIVPLPYRGESVGVLKIYSSAPSAFTDQDLLTVQLLAGPLAIGLSSVTEADALNAQRVADRRFAATFEQAAVGIAHVAPDGRFLLMNDRYCEIVGRSRAEVLKGDFQGMTHPDDLPLDLRNVEELLAGLASSYAMEKRYIRKDGTAIWVNLTVSLVRDEAGEPDFFVAVAEDISARKLAEDEAVHDGLTGLLNRRGLLQKLTLELGRHYVAERSLALAYVDLDGFKAVNDDHGHAEGDRCLVKVASAIQAALRADDVVARVGGDEFVALLPMTSPSAAEQVLSRVARAVAEICEGESWQTTASIGIVVVPPNAHPNASNIITAADMLMYSAKRSKLGKPAISILSPSPQAPGRQT